MSDKLTVSVDDGRGGTVTNSELQAAADELAWMLSNEELQNKLDAADTGAEFSAICEQYRQEYRKNVQAQAKES